MRDCLRGALLSSLCLLADACSRPAPVLLTASEYVLDDYGFSLRLPEGWRVMENSGGLRWQARPYESGQPVPGVYFLVDRDMARPASAGFPEVAPSLDSYVARSEELAQRDALAYRVAATGAIDLDGVKAIWNERAYASYTMKRRSLAVITVRGNYGYLLTGASTDATFQRWQPSFRAIAASLRWRSSTAGSTPASGAEPDQNLPASVPPATRNPS
jgi:hypothetical protein